MYFLATPHRGADSAQLLKHTIGVARTSCTSTAKPRPESLTNQSINDEFRQYSGNLQLWSFYEVRKTPVRMRNVVIVDPQSAVLHYGLERQTPLDANHWSICQFDSPEDSNYRRLRNSLATTMRDIEKHQPQAKETTTRGPAQGIGAAPDGHQYPGICMTSSPFKKHPAPAIGCCPASDSLNGRIFLTA